MDFFAHGFWTYIVFHWVKRPYLAVLFGLAPDLISWGPLFLLAIFTRTLPFGRPDLFTIPSWTQTMYNIGHSLFLWLVVFGIFFYFYRKKVLFILAAPLAIVMDLFSHSREFFPTPFLWPLSNWYFPGISWGTATFMIVNWSLIFLSLTAVIIYKYLKKKGKFKKKAKK